MNEKSKRKPMQPECPICGGFRFEWGKAHIFRSNTYPLAFRSENAGFFESSKPIQARQCRDCGNVQLFADMD